MEERILAVFPIDIHGFFYDFYDMYFTDRRILANSVGRGNFPRAQGKSILFAGLLGLLEYGVLRPLAEQKDHVPLSDPEQILKAHKKNFAWDYRNDIKSIRFKNKTGWATGGRVMEVKLSQGKHRLCVFREEHFDDLRSLLLELAGDKVVHE